MTAVQRSVVLLGVVLLGFACDRNPRPRRVRLEVTDENTVKNVAGRPVLRVAVAPVISPVRSLPLYTGLTEYLAERVGRDARLLQRNSYAQVNELVRLERCDLAFVCTYAFVRGEKDFGMDLLVIPQIDGKRIYHSYILVPKESPAQSLLDLRNKPFASADALSNTGWLFPSCWLREHGENPDRFFARVVFTGSHDRSVEALAEGLVEGAAVDSLVYNHLTELGSRAASRCRVVFRSDGFGMPPVVVHPKLDSELRAALKAVLLAAHEDEAGRKALEILGIERFVEPSAKDYDSVRAMVRLFEER